MVLYLLLCLISVLAGCGILALIGVDVDRRNTLFLTPVLTLCSLALVMGGLVAGGFSVGKITPAVYILCFGAAILGAIRHGKTVLASWRSLLIIAGLPLLILLPTLIEGFENYAGGTCLDAWSYVTLGQSLQQHPLGADGWLPVEVQYAAQWGKAIRFISPAFLAFLAPLSGDHNDTQEVLGRYVGWLFFVYGCACFFFVKVTNLGRSMAWVFVFLVMLSGWTLKLVDANSVDNTLAMCFIPAVLGIFALMPAPSIRYGIVLGAILAAGLYAYPESWPFTAAALLAVGTQRLIAAPHQLREFGRMGVALLITLGVCISPHVFEIASFYRHEVTAATQTAGPRPGESFYHSLFTPRSILPGFWGLTPDLNGQAIAETYLRHYDLYTTAMACILTLASLFGMFLLLRRLEWSLPFFVVGMTTAYAIVLAHLRYPYAAYKLLVLTWFAITYTVVVAAGCALEMLSRRCSKWIGYSGVGLGLGLLTAIGGLFLLQERIFYDLLPFKSLREFKKVSMVENLAHGAPVAMTVNEMYANIWGAHFLHKTKLYLAGQYRGYMAGITSVLDRSEPVDPSDIRFVVTDSEGSFKSERLLSRAGPYYIWDCSRGPWALLTEIKSPDGVIGGAESSFKTYAELRVLSSAATSAVINADFVVGPLPGKAQQRVHIGARGFEEERIIANGKHSFTVPLQPGLNPVLLRSLEKTPMVTRLARLSVSIPPAGKIPQIRDIENPNGLESWYGKEPFFWMGGGDTTITLSASAAGIAEVTAILLPGPSLIDKSKARLEIIRPFGGKIQQSLDWGPARIDVPVQPGLNTIVMRTIGPNGPNVGYLADPRIMMIGFRNPQVSYLEQPSKSK